MIFCRACRPKVDGWRDLCYFSLADMFKERTPAWIMTGGLLLTLAAGCINAIGFLGFLHQPVSHLTGTVTQFGADLVARDFSLVLRTGLTITCFFFGAFLSAAITRQSSLKVGRRYGAVLTLESALLVAAFFLLQRGQAAGDYFCVVACGLQNAMATSYSGAVLRSTHLTGIITDLGIACGHAARGQPVDWLRMRLYGTLLIGFFLGSVLGAWGFYRWSYATLLGPAALAGFAGVGYTVYKHLQRHPQLLTRVIPSFRAK